MRGSAIGEGIREYRLLDISSQIANIIEDSKLSPEEVDRVFRQAKALSDIPTEMLR